MLCVFFLGEAKGATRGTLPPFFLEISPCENFVMENHPSEEVNFGEAFYSSNALPKVIVIMIRYVCKKVVASGGRVLARSVSPSFGVFDRAGFRGFTF